ncbi:hypothetical protein KAR91_18845 [Candidatus Pacearchaeota archaeon]|nr:hypothetical protein [Candidatus Pacearchaeota archaeon]
MKKTTVLYHRDPDGFGAAFAAWLVLKDTADYISVQHGEPVPFIPGGTEELFILDFCYNEDTCVMLVEKYATTIIDHHKSARAVIEGLCGCTFNINKSGAELAWEHFHPGDATPPLIAYIQDYDLWKFELPHSVEINLAIATLPLDFEVWAMMPTELGAFQAATIPVGVGVKAFQDGQVAYAMNNVRIMMLGEHQVPFTNAVDNISVVGHTMCQHYPEAPFSISYHDTKEYRKWSLRSIGDFDVAEFAKIWGGGGHKNSAGFETALDWPEYCPPEKELAFAEACAGFARESGPAGHCKECGTLHGEECKCEDKT